MCYHFPSSSPFLFQRAFPQDYRIVDKDTGADKGPFWSEKKRYPEVPSFDLQDESHLNFMVSSTCLFGVAIGIFPAKEETDADWLKQCRSPEWMAAIVPALKVPEYLGAPVTTDDDTPAGLAGAAADKTAALESVLRQLQEAATDISLPPLDPADFEKDDDLNFHISFVTSACNLRCDNYSISRTDFHACKIIAGKIIAAIATTTAAVCGLVMLELFKLQLGCDTEAFMNRQIGLAVNAYTSFTQEPPICFKTYTEVTQPLPGDVPSEAFDDKGVMKDEFLTKELMVAYPENHSTWDKLVAKGSWSLDAFKRWLSDEHKLRLIQWDMVLGYHGKDRIPVSKPVWPPKPTLDLSLLPSLELSMQQATVAIMRTATAKPTQQYIQAWRDAKANGALPAANGAEKGALAPITAAMTLRELVVRMGTEADQVEKEGRLDLKALSFVNSRVFWLVPSNEAPVCETLEDGNSVATLASIKILLNE